MSLLPDFWVVPYRVYNYYLTKLENSYPRIYQNRDLIFSIIHIYKDQRFYKILALLSRDTYVGYYDNFFKDHLNRALEEEKDIENLLKSVLEYDFSKFEKYDYLLQKEILFLNFLTEYVLLNPKTELNEKIFYKLKKKILIDSIFSKDFRKFSSLIQLEDKQLAVRDVLDNLEYYQNIKEKLIKFFKEEIRILAFKKHNESV